VQQVRSQQAYRSNILLTYLGKANTHDMCSGAFFLISKRNIAVQLCTLGARKPDPFVILTLLLPTLLERSF
jgi:hypothetical protein